MKKFLKIFLAAVFILIMTFASVTTAFADSAVMGDTVLVKVYVEGAEELTTLRATFSFDPNRLDYLSSDSCGIGMTVVNDQVEGEFTWASIFVDSEVNFLKETEVMEITFIAKTDIENIESEFRFDIKNAYDENSMMIDLSHIKTSIVVAGEGFIEESEPESRIEFNTTESNTFSSSVQSSAENNTESESEKTVVSTTSNGIVITYDDSEFAEQPPIKFDQQEKTDEHRTFKIVSVSAVVFFLLIALIAFIMLKIKKDD